MCRSGQTIADLRPSPATSSGWPLANAAQHAALDAIPCHAILKLAIVDGEIEGGHVRAGYAFYILDRPGQ